mgnify:FL=1
MKQNLEKETHTAAELNFAKVVDATCFLLICAFIIGLMIKGL